MSRKVLYLCLIVFFLFGTAGLASAEEGGGVYSDAGSGFSSDLAGLGNNFSDLDSSGSALNIELNGLDSNLSDISSPNLDFNIEGPGIGTDSGGTVASSMDPTAAPPTGSELSAHDNTINFATADLDAAETGEFELSDPVDTADISLPAAQDAAETGEFELSDPVDTADISLPAAQDAAETGEFELSDPVDTADISLPAAQADEAVCEIDASAEASAGLADPYFFVGRDQYSFFVDGDPVNDDQFNYYGLGPGAIQAAIDHIELYGTVPSNGMIYVESGSYNGFTIDGFLPYLSALKGVVWDVLGATVPEISDDIFVSNVLSGFTLSGFIVDGEVYFDNCVGQLNLSNLAISGAGDGLTVWDHTGNVVVNNVISSHNDGWGAWIETAGNVTITNSAFDYNDGDNPGGINIHSTGAVNIDSISASNNTGNGLIVTDFSRLTVKNGVFNNNRHDNPNPEDNYGWGFGALSPVNAQITVDNLIANGNSMYGMWLETGGNVVAGNVHAHNNDLGGMYVDNSSGRGTVRLTNGRFFDNQDWDGLVILSSGAVTVSSVQASGNAYEGAYIDNTTGTGNVTVTSPANMGFAGANSFHNNDSTGLKIYSNGSITVTNAEANNNTASGVWLENGSGNITLNTNIAGWNNHFWENYQGIGIMTTGNVIVMNSSASGNDRYGVFTHYDYLDPDPATAPNNVTISNGRFDWNGYNGLLIFARGNITVTDVGASDNGWDDDPEGHSGMFLCNGGGFVPGSRGRVTIRSSDREIYHQFNDNTGYGIGIVSNGAVSVSNVEASDNPLHGIFVYNADSDRPAAVSITGANAWSNGHDDEEDGIYDGIHVVASGAITLMDVRSEGNNYGHGAYLDNAGGSGNVTIRSSVRDLYYQFNGNGIDGICIESSGAVNVSNVEMHHNSGSGLYVDNSFASRPSAVTLTNVRSSENDLVGIHVHASGAVTMNNLQVHWNNAGGVLINNAGEWDGFGDPIWTGSGNVMVRAPGRTLYNDINGNADFGLEILTNGTVSLNNVMAHNNFGTGAYIEYMGTPGRGTVTLVNCGFFDQKGTGLEIITDGSVTLNRVKAMHSRPMTPGPGDYYGAFVYAGTGNVIVIGTRTDFSNFSNNNADGLYIYAAGNVAITNTHAHDNDWSGIVIEGARNVSVQNNARNEASWVGNNGGVGLVIWYPTGTVTLRGSIIVSGNGAEGLVVEADSPNARVTVAGLTANHNFGDNIVIITTSDIALSNIWANHSQTGGGASLGYLGRVTISGNNEFSGNNQHGLGIETFGLVSIRGVTAHGNEMEGIVIFSGGMNTTTLTQVSAFYNGHSGIHVEYVVGGYGAVTLTNVSAYSNGFDDNKHGIFVDSNHSPIRFTNCAFIGNAGSGIFVETSLDRLFFRNTTYIGNNADNVGDDPNLRYVMF